MRVRNESPVRHQSIEVERPKPPPPPQIEAKPKVDQRSVERAARRTSEFEVGTPRRTGPAVAEPQPATRPAGPGPSIPPLTPEENERIADGLPPGGGAQAPWVRNDNFPEPAALAGLFMERSHEQGLLTDQQIVASAGVANRAVPSQEVRTFSPSDVAALAREAGIPLDRLDASQALQASRLINSATSPQEQRDRIALSLDNLSVVAQGRTPELTRDDMTAQLWAQASVPGHALQGLNDSELRAAYEQVTRAVNQPGPHKVEVGQYDVNVNVGADGSLANSETKRDSFISRVGGAIGSAAGDALKAVGDTVLGAFPTLLSAVGIEPPGFGPKYPTDPSARASDAARIQAELGGALAKLPAYQTRVLDQMRGLGVDDVDLFRGSHVVVNDGGRLYEEWSHLDAKARTSSHYPGTEGVQYEIEFEGVGPLLFGRDPQGNTWFQFENASGDGVNLDHIGDYFKYKLSGDLNIGPAGNSPHSELRDPIRVDDRRV